MVFLKLLLELVVSMVMLVKRVTEVLTDVMEVLENQVEFLYS